MSAVLTLAGQDISAATLYDVTVGAGRGDIDQQPDASVLSATVEGWRPAGRIGDRVTLRDVHGPLFGGVVTDIDCQWWKNPKTGGKYWRTRITAVGPLADLGRTYIGDEPWPQETDSVRLDRILALARAPYLIDTGIPGPDLLPRDVDYQPALELAQGVAADARGLLWEQPGDLTTPIRYQPSQARSWDPARMLTLDAGDVLATVTVTQRLGDVIRKVRVTYGPDPGDGSPRAQAVAGSGTPELQFDTQLADATDAQGIADTVWKSRREAGWRLQQLAVPLHLIDPADAAAIRDWLAVGALLQLVNINFDSPLGTIWNGYLEGWQHQLTNGEHQLIMFTSERRLTEPADRWQDISGAVHWQDVSPDTSWGELALSGWGGM